jgi:DNA-binding IscR family transcriptional regulator
VYNAVEDESVFALHPSTPNQECPVGRGIPPVLRAAYERAEHAMTAALAEVTIAQVLRDTVRGRDLAR